MPKEWKKPKPTEGQRAKAASDAKKTIARNKKARHDYTIEDTWEAGRGPHGYRGEGAAHGPCVPRGRLG